MKKIEIIWRELLFEAQELGNRRFVQQDLAVKFGFSTSTIFQALKTPRKMGAVRVSGRNFMLEDPDKLLYYWASFRKLTSDITLTGRVDADIFAIEGQMPPGVVFAGYSAARNILKVSPADYDKVYVYSDPKAIEKRFRLATENPNLFVLRKDEFLESYGQQTTLAQTFVDLWNLSDWYAKEFTNALKQKIDELLS